MTTCPRCGAKANPKADHPALGLEREPMWICGSSRWTHVVTSCTVFSQSAECCIAQGRRQGHREAYKAVYRRRLVALAKDCPSWDIEECHHVTTLELASLKRELAKLRRR